jgi:hypothetical protein
MRIFLAGVRKSSTLLRPVYEGICRRNGIGVHQIPGGERGDVDPDVLRQVRDLDCSARRRGDIPRSELMVTTSLVATHQKGDAVLHWLRR